MFTTILYLSLLTMAIVAFTITIFLLRVIHFKYTITTKVTIKPVTAVVILTLDVESSQRIKLTPPSTNISWYFLALCCVVNVMTFEMVIACTEPADELAVLQQPFDEEAQLGEGVTQHIETQATQNNVQDLLENNPSLDKEEDGPPETCCPIVREKTQTDGSNAST